METRTFKVSGKKCHKQVRVTVLEPTPQPNEAMLMALKKVAERSKNMPFSDGEDSLQILREARAGKMFGLEKG